MTVGELVLKLVLEGDKARASFDGMSKFIQQTNRKNLDELKALQSKLQAAYSKKIELKVGYESLDKTKQQIELVTARINRFAKDTEQSGSRIGSAFGRIGDFAQKTFYIFRSFGMVTNAMQSMLRESNAAAAAFTKVETAVRSTGGTAGFSAVELKKFAEELQKTTTFDADQILNDTSAQLLTFTNITGEQFKRTQVAAMDLATMLGGDLQGASIMLGKALNDPVSNLGALSRAGVQFSTDQEKMIKALFNAGDAAKAQSIILDELNKQYGGQAAAAAKTGEGAIKQFQNAVGGLMEVGGQLMTTFIVPFINMAKPIVELLSKMDQGTAKMIVILTATIAVLVKIPAILGGISAAAKALGISVKIASGPVGWLVALIGLVAAAWAGNLGGIQEKTKAVFNFLGAAFSGLYEFIKNFAANIGNIFGGIGKLIAGVFTVDIDKIKEGLSQVKSAVSEGFSNTLAATKAKFEEHLNDIDERKKEEQKKQNENPYTIPVVVKTAGSASAAAPSGEVSPIEISGPRGAPSAAEQAAVKEIEIERNKAETVEQLVAESNARRQALAEEFYGAYFSGYDVFWQTIYDKDMTGAQRADAVWQTMRNSFTKLMADKLKALLVGELKVTSGIKTEGAKQIAARRAFAAEDAVLAGKSILLRLKELAANLWAWFSKLGPFGMIGGAAAIAGFVMLAKKAISGIQAMAEGGLVQKPTLALVGEAGPEIVAPQKNFMDVIRGAQISGALAGGGGMNNTDVISRLDKIEQAITGLNLRVTAEEIYLMSDTGARRWERKRV